MTYDTDTVEKILRIAAAQARQIVRAEAPNTRWATIVSTDPVRVKYDNETAPSPVTPIGGHNLPAGTRVIILKTHGQPTIIYPQNAGD